MKKLASFRHDDTGRKPNQHDFPANEQDAHNLLQRIVAWEQGELSEQATLDLFQVLVSTGVAWKCHGSVRRTAALLISQGRIRQ
jgi:hypothetical protein